ncbi:MAG: hypothetical protein ACJAWT_001667 [Glaciecola sp.]|jgi:hypothetical protein
MTNKNLQARKSQVIARGQGNVYPVYVERAKMQRFGTLKAIVTLTLVQVLRCVIQGIVILKLFML